MATASSLKTTVFHLQKMKCSIFYTGCYNTELAKVKKRTLTLASAQGKGDACILKIEEKSKDCNQSSVIFCGLHQCPPAAHTQLKRPKLKNMALVFDTVTVCINLNHDKEKAAKIYEDVEKRCIEHFGFRSSYFLDIKQHPLSCNKLRSTKRVMLSVTKYQVSLSQMWEPYTAIVSWSLDQIDAVKALNGTLVVTVKKEGQYQFTSQADASLCDRINGDIEMYLPVYDETLPEYSIDLNSFSDKIKISFGEYLTPADCSAGVNLPTDCRSQQISFGEYLTLADCSAGVNLPTDCRSQQAPNDNKEIVKTLEAIIKCKPPECDTLQLSHETRSEICFKLYSPENNWKCLAGIIGLRVDAVTLIDHLINSQCTRCTATDIVLRHWQHVYNLYGETSKDGKCPRACTKKELEKIFLEMGRHDLRELIVKDSHN